MTTQEFAKRIRSFRSYTAVGALVVLSGVFGWFALLGWLDVRIHQEVPTIADHEVAAIAVVGPYILGPIVLLILAFVFSNRLARRLGLLCPHCGTLTPLSLRNTIITGGRCTNCGTAIVGHMAEQPGPAQPATQPTDKVPAKDQPSTPTSKDAPR